MSEKNTHKQTHTHLQQTVIFICCSAAAAKREKEKNILKLKKILYIFVERTFRSSCFVSTTHLKICRNLKHRLLMTSISKSNDAQVSPQIHAHNVCELGCCYCFFHLLPSNNTRRHGHIRIPLAKMK